MRILIRPMGWSPTSLTLVRQRLEYALGRFGNHVRSLSVRLTDLNGPRGGVDKKCLIAVRLDRPRRTIVIEEVDVDPMVAVGRAAQRASRAVSRAIESAGSWRLLVRGH